MVKSSYEDTHSKILENGKKHFLKYGFEKANLRDICKDAGVTTGAFYRHFNDKNELFEALVDPIANRVLSNFSQYETASISSVEAGQNEKVEKVHIEGTLETAMFLFENKELYFLLIHCAYGTSYANFLEKLTTMEDHTRRKVREITSGADNSSEQMGDTGIHIINHAHFVALTEVVLRSESKRELLENAELVSRFFAGGWKNVRGF